MKSHLKALQAVFLSMILSFYGCSLLPESDKAQCQLVGVDDTQLQALSIRDDLELAQLKQGLLRSQEYLRRLDPDETVEICGQSITNRERAELLDQFDWLLGHSADNIAEEIRQRFRLCQSLNSSGGRDILATGYYQPRVKGSFEPKPPFIYPLYRLPPDLIPALEFAEEKRAIIGRLENRRLVPYWTRAEIEQGEKLKGLELLYLADPMEVFILHVQGSGMVEFPDGTVKQVLFAGSNGRPYSSIGRLLADEGKMPLAEITLPGIKQYLHEHLDDRQRILHYNERYIFFRLADESSDGPIGSMGYPLVPGRSVALDNSCFPLGGVYYLTSSQPHFYQNGAVQRWQPLERFVLHQDTGAAIRGSGRLDFFWGSGPGAAAAAGAMKHSAQLFMLLPKAEQTTADAD